MVELVASLVASEAILLGLWIAVGRGKFYVRFLFAPAILLLIYLVHGLCFPIPQNAEDFEVIAEDIGRFAILTFIPAAFLSMCRRTGCLLVGTTQETEKQSFVPQFTISDFLITTGMLGSWLATQMWCQRLWFAVDALPIIFGIGVCLLELRPQKALGGTMLSLTMAFVTVVIPMPSSFLESTTHLTDWIGIVLVAVSLVPYRLSGLRLIVVPSNR